MSKNENESAPKVKPAYWSKWTVSDVSDHRVIDNELEILVGWNENIIGEFVPAAEFMGDSVVREYLATVEFPPVPLPGGANGYLDQPTKIKKLNAPYVPWEVEEKMSKVLRVFEEDGIDMVEYTYDGDQTTLAVPGLEILRQMPLAAARVEFTRLVRDYLVEHGHVQLELDYFFKKGMAGLETMPKSKTSKTKSKPKFKIMAATATVTTKTNTEFTLRAVADHCVLNNQLYLFCYYEPTVRLRVPAGLVPADDIKDHPAAVKYLARTTSKPVPLPGGGGYVNQPMKIKALGFTGDLDPTLDDPEEEKHTVLCIRVVNGSPKVDYIYDGDKNVRQMSLGEAQIKFTRPLCDFLMMGALAAGEE
ncbi:hypothetical protein Q8F55_006011 [Vanrija albida]|uniref:Uncharacterized protein n=1 Tax=Vanrija albida TaxID=181172 RepID=A0ABR3Q373_9TREE